VLLTHLGDRGITMRRFPNGVDAGSFFEKRCPSHRPQWVQVSPGPGDRGGAIDYCRLADEASIVWAANLAALELHAPMARGVDIETPTMVVFDLDPGAPADINDCAEVGMWIRDVLDGLGLQCFAKTSGSKGLQVYVPVNRPPLTHEQASGFALAVAQAMEKHHGDRVLSNMRKELRKGKVFIDWSQNSRHKTTICAYSLRARPEPTVSTPVTWDEVDAAAGGAPLSFEAPDVLERVDEDGDLWDPTATLQQDLPLPAG
jgi:bifunctional non-homologous end joining protein LigD